MARIVFTYVVPFLLPMTLYFVWVWYRARYVAQHGGEAPRFETGPWPQLLFAGAVLAFISFAATTMTHTDGPGSVYTPPHVENGKIVPGRADPRP